MNKQFTEQNRTSKGEKEKTWAASLVVSEIQIKGTTNYYSLIRMVKIMQSKLLQPFRKASINILNRPISYLGIHLSVIKVPAFEYTYKDIYWNINGSGNFFLKNLNAMNRGNIE